MYSDDICDYISNGVKYTYEILIFEARTRNCLPQMSFKYCSANKLYINQTVVDVIGPAVESLKGQLLPLKTIKPVADSLGMVIPAAYRPNHPESVDDFMLDYSSFYYSSFYYEGYRHCSFLTIDEASQLDILAAQSFHLLNPLAL